MLAAFLLGILVIVMNQYIPIQMGNLPINGSMPENNTNSVCPMSAKPAW